MYSTGVFSHIFFFLALLLQAPLIQQQREEYERLSAQHTQITQRLESCVYECDKLKGEKAVLLRENKALKQGKRGQTQTKLSYSCFLSLSFSLSLSVFLSDTVNLSAQIQHLLRTHVTQSGPTTVPLDSLTFRNVEVRDANVTLNPHTHTSTHSLFDSLFNAVICLFFFLHRNFKRAIISCYNR